MTEIATAIFYCPFLYRGFSPLNLKEFSLKIGFTRFPRMDVGMGVFD